MVCLRNSKKAIVSRAEVVKDEIREVMVARSDNELVDLHKAFGVYTE